MLRDESVLHGDDGFHVQRGRRRRGPVPRVEVEIGRDDPTGVTRETEVQRLGTRRYAEKIVLAIEQSVIFERADGHRGFPVLAVLVSGRKLRAEPRDLVRELAAHDPTEVVVLEILDVADLVVAEPDHRAGHRIGRFGDSLRQRPGSPSMLTTFFSSRYSTRPAGPRRSAHVVSWSRSPW